MRVQLADYFYSSVVLLLLVIISSCFYIHNVVADTDHQELKAFPAAKVGMERFVIVLKPHDGKEESMKVEIIPGKVILTDGVNLNRLGVAVEPRILTGWGYTYYEVTGNDVVMRTMMAPTEGGEQVEAFVAGTSILVRYNSRLPIVVYAPEKYEIRYRIWEASDTTNRQIKNNRSTM